MRVWIIEAGAVVQNKVTSSAGTAVTAPAQRSYADFLERMQELKKRGLLVTIDRPVDKDAEWHPLVRWQFVGDIAE